jgi:ubiquinone/menaquinone biosynthesis C-methylase UbiE
MKYFFKSVENCNMCGAPATQAKVLGKRMNQSQGKRPVAKSGITTTVVQCTFCNLIYPNPLPIPETIEQHYGVPPENYWLPQYFNIDPNYFKVQLDTFFKLYGLNTGLTALDIGAGIGKCMVAIQNAGIDAYGFEPSEPFYQKALEKMRIDSSKLVLSSVEDASYPEQTFDFITFGAVLEHLYDPSAAIEKALRWLKHGGLIHIEVPSSKWLVNRIANTLYKLQGLDYVANISPMHNPYHIYEFGLESFKKNAALHHYKLVHHSYEVCETYLPKFLNALAVPYMRSTDTGMQLEVWLRKEE